MARMPETNTARESADVITHVEQSVQRRIGESSISIEDVAKELNTSKRTLQRNLKDRNVTFFQLRDKVRRRRSIQLLLNTNMPIDHISEHIGFTDRTSFTNAFRRWTGDPPSRFRKDHRLSTVVCTEEISSE